MIKRKEYVMKLKWDIDNRTQNAAMKYCPINRTTPAEQFIGYNFNRDKWKKRIRKSDNFSLETGKSSPQEIINAFKKEQYLQGLALVVSWGRMWRQNRNNYYYQLDDIRNAIQRCAKDIVVNQSIAQSWKILTNLKWSAVLTSKTLHFLCRALAHDNKDLPKSLPVAIDNLVIRNKVWPAFVKDIPCSERPENWEGTSFEAYSRYMTAILVWAKKRNWSTTDVEVTLFDEYLTQKHNQ